MFDNDTFDIRSDGRISDQLNVFGRYSFADYTRDGPTAFGQGGGQELVSLGGTSKVRNQSIAAGFDRSIGSNMTVDFRFGYFKYKVAVLPFDFGTTPARDAGIPGLNLDTGFTSGLFGGFVGEDNDNRRFRFGSGLGVNRCNCPLDQDEKQAQFVTNVTRLTGNHTVKFGVDVRRAWNLRVPSDRHRSGELTFSSNRTIGPSGGGLALATFLLGDVTDFARYVSPFTDAGERQWRHFYYAQDTWRATGKLTLNYGLRLDFINPQTVSDAGKGGMLLASVSDARFHSVAQYGRRRRRWHSAERRRQEPRELGAACRRDVSAERENRAARRIWPQLRHRRVRIVVRPHGHAESAGSRGTGPERALEFRGGLQPA